MGIDLLHSFPPGPGVFPLTSMEQPGIMWQGLVNRAIHWLHDLNRAWLGLPGAGPPEGVLPPATSVCLQPLESLWLTDGVGRTLFEEFAAHRAAARGEEETGWVLLGLREARQAVVLATLPAGAQRDASTTHVLFNCMAQAVASRIVRQTDKRLTILGVVHTHAGSLRHPSEGDFQGDHPWVTQRRGGEGVFGIGTADGTARPDQLFVEQPRPNVQVHQQLTFSWYALGSQDTNYRPLPVSMTLGPDLARPLHTVWSTIETHADQLERLFQQQKGLTCAVSEEEQALVLTLPLAEPGCAIRVVLTEKKVNYYLLRHDQVVAFPCGDDRVDRGVYLLLAEWVAQE